MDRLFTYVCHFWKFKNHRRIQVIEYGGAKIQNKSLFATAIEARRMRNFLEKWQWNAIKTVSIVFRIHRRCQGTESGRSNNASLFRYLNPPMISEVHKKQHVCLFFYIIYCCRRFAKLIQTVMFNIYHDYRPKNLLYEYHLPNYHALETASVAAINLKFSDNVPRFVLGKVRKFQDPSSSRLGDI